MSTAFSLFLFAGFFQLLLSGAFKVFIELLTEIRKRRYRIILAAVRRNLIGIQQLVGTNFIDIKEERGTAAVRYRENNIGIRIICHMFFECLGCLTAVQRLDINIR